MSSKLVSIPVVKFLACAFCFGFSVNINAGSQVRFDEEALWQAMKAHYEEQLNHPRASELHDHEYTVFGYARLAAEQTRKRIEHARCGSLNEQRRRGGG